MITNQSRRFPGIRAAAVTYLIILIVGLAGAGAHALWSQTGSVTSSITAGTWAPAPVSASTVTCLRRDGSSNGVLYSDITLNWTATDATSYTTASLRNGSSPAATTTTTSPPATLRLQRANLTGTVTYTITITPKAGNVEAAPTSITATLRDTTVSCTPL